MEIKFFAFFFTVFTVQIVVGRYWMFSFFEEVPRRELSDSEKKDFENKVKAFLDFIILNETSKLWHKPKFHECYNNESYPYNMAIISFKQQSVEFLENYMHISRNKHLSLIDDIKQCVKSIANLLEKIRNNIYIVTQREDFERSIKDNLYNFKEQIQVNMTRIYEDVLSIRDTALVEFQKNDLTKANTKLINEFEKMENASKTFVRKIKKCMKAANTKS